MKRHRLRAPSADGALLAVPPLSEAGDRLRQNAANLAHWDHDFQGRRAGALRAMARAEAIERARQHLERFDLAPCALPDPGAPWIAAGHQPALFHAGVWIKNFALAGLAQRYGAAGLNLVVDNDIPKGAFIRVPHQTPQGLAARPVEYDWGAGEVPYEDLKTRDEALFATFGERATQLLGGLVPDPVLADFWPRALRYREATDRTGLRLAAARRALEADWGACNWEVPLSALCETHAFYWFTSHLLAHLDRFQQVHNAALARYRKLYGIRSTHHPVPALRRDGAWLEAPFWVWRPEQTRRRPLLVRQLARTIELRCQGEPEPFLELPLAPDREACCAVERLQTLPSRRVRLRTRALTTTLYARLLLADVFIHGIGGAKYDELGDEVVRGFYQCEPPSYLTLSATLWLGLDTDRATPEQLRSTERALRDLRFNPERHLSRLLGPELEAQVAAKRRAISGPIGTHAERVDRFRQIRRCNEVLQPAALDARTALEQERARLLEALKDSAVAENREYAFVLHSQRRIRAAMEKHLGPLWPKSRS